MLALLSVRAALETGKLSSRITLCGDYRHGLGSREERKSALLGLGTDTTERFGAKLPSEADIYALGIRQMLTPIPNHPLLLMRSIRDKIHAARFPNDADGSSFAALGTIGVMGFVILICVAVGRPRGRILGDARLRVNFRLRRRFRVNRRGRRVWQLIQRFCCSRIPGLQPN